MSVDQDTINYGVRATLRTFPAGSTGSVLARGAPAQETTLADAVRRFLRLSDEEQASASIGVDAGVLEGTNGLIKAKDIRAIARRSDFPAQ